MVDAAVQTYGRIDVMLNNAGLMPHSPLERLKIDDWNRMIDVNIKGVLYGIAAALPHMQAQKSGHIINTSSVAALYGSVYQTLYVATKNAVIGLTDCLYYEYLPENIFFTVVCPGNVETPIFRGRAPEDSVPVEEAVRIILDGVAKKERLVVFPEFMKDLLEKCKDPVFRDLVHKQAEADSRKIFASPEYQKFLAEQKKH